MTDVVRCHEEPYVPLTPSIIISRLAAANRVTVLLSGLGGDELFCGYGREQFLRHWQRISRGHRMLRRCLPPITSRLRRARRTGAVTSFADGYVLAFSPVAEAIKRSLFSTAALPPESSFEKFRQLYQPPREPRDPVQAACYYDLVHYVGNHHVYREDQFAMHAGIEARYPLLDHEVVELAFAMPSVMKVRAGQGKHVLRSIAGDLIGRSCLSMGKRGFSLPWARWAQGPFASLIRDSINELGERPQLNARGLQRVYDRFRQTNEGAVLIWHLVSIELWMREFFDDVPSQRDLTTPRSIHRIQETAV